MNGIFFFILIFAVTYSLFQEMKIKDELNPFHANDISIHPENNRKTSGFFMLVGCIERDKWHEMG